MCDILFQDKALNKLVLNGKIWARVSTFSCFSQFSTHSTEKLNRSTSSWQHEFFTIDVDRQYELNGIGRIFPGNTPMSKNQVFHIFLTLKFWELICQILMSRALMSHIVTSSINHIYEDNSNTSITD